MDLVLNRLFINYILFNHFNFMLNKNVKNLCNLIRTKKSKHEKTTIGPNFNWWSNDCLWLWGYEKEKHY